MRGLLLAAAAAFRVLGPVPVPVCVLPAAKLQNANTVMDAIMR